MDLPSVLWDAVYAISHLLASDQRQGSIKLVGCSLRY
eukprot:COSAG02_NODE_41032_length_399_cov_0.506667_1_plen_36_part_10